MIRKFGTVIKIKISASLPAVRHAITELNKKNACISC